MDFYQSKKLKCEKFLKIQNTQNQKKTAGCSAEIELINLSCYRQVKKLNYKHQQKIIVEKNSNEKCMSQLI